MCEFRGSAYFQTISQTIKHICSVNDLTHSDRHARMIDQI